VLLGFKEWLVVRFDGGSNLRWEVLLTRYAPDGARESNEDDKMVQFLFGELDAFCRARESYDGTRRIFLAYERWLRGQEWYVPGSPSWFSLKEE